MALSNINDVVDKSIEEAIYQVALDNVYTPDRDISTTKILYDASLAAIVIAKGFAIEIFGAASNKSRDGKKVPRIVYDNIGFVEGSIGGSAQPHYEDAGATFDKKLMPIITGDLRFKITLISKTSTQDRVLHAIMAEALPNMGRVLFYNDPTNGFILRYLYQSFNPDLKEGIIEKTYFYEAIDLFETEDKVLQTGVAKILEISVCDEDENLTIGPIT
jgi:hypothetical protein